MFGILPPLSDEYDWRLVALAAIICLLSSLATVSLFHRARAAEARTRAAWVILAGAASGCGIWATHFIAMIAMLPRMAITYNADLIATSFAVATLATSAGLCLAISNRARYWRAALGGAVIGTGVASIHSIGILALQAPINMTWTASLIALSIFAAVMLAALALTVAIRNPGPYGTIAAAVLLTLAIMSHHHIAMAATQVVPDPMLALPEHGLSLATLALAVAGGAVAVLGMSLVGAVADVLVSRRKRQFARERQALLADSEEQLRQQNIRLDAALNNMTQGLCMFNAKEEVVVLNRRYLEMYKLSPQVAKPGCTLRQLLQHRKDVGLLDGDPQEYYQQIQDELRHSRASTWLIRTTEGRLIQACTQPMPGGAWVATHEDVTERRRAEEQLLKQKLQLDTALNNMSQGLNMFDAMGRLVVCSERYLQMYKLAPDTARPGCTVRDLVDARIANGTFFSVDPERYTEELLEAMRKGEPTHATMQLTDGRTIEVIGHPTPDGGGWVVTHEDITQRRSAEIERDRSRTFANIVIENVPSTIAVKDAATLRYALVNKAGEEYYGLSRDSMIGKRTEEVFSPQEADTITRHDRELLETKRPQFYDERPVKTPGGEHRIASTTRIPILDAQGEPQYLLTVIDDHTRRKRAEAEIARLVHYDMLTGLPNRAAFTACIDATIETAAREGHPFALMSLDFDRFKEVNDVYGHAAGDEFLRQAAKRLQAVAGGAFVARLGGDEFVVIATDGDQPAAAETLADRLRAAIGEEFVINGQALNGSVSIGIALFPADASDAATLLGNADASLYRAKSEGRNTVRFFEAGMDKRLRERRVLQQELRSAVERGELTMHYQPQARISGEIIGFEALARWQHPQRGMIPPDVFIPLAEESGTIIAMGEWIMREACREAASWPTPLQVAINLSPVQFRHGDLPELVDAVLKNTGLSPSRLELEITEGVLIDDFARAVAILRRLKGLGVRVAMDDFGTGYSSLSYLQSFPFDKIKIDQAFISNLERNPQSATIVRAVIGLARGLELPVLAEGVETKEQRAFLAKESCDQIQGYLVGRPSPIEDYAAWTGQPRKLLRMRARVN